MSEKYSRYTSDEKLMMAEVPNHGIYPIFMTIKPYIKGDYKLIAPNLSPTFIQFLIAKANFILPPLKSSDNAPYLIVIDKYAVLDPNTGVLSIGSIQIHGLEPVFFYSKDISVLRVKQ
ncbi:MAG: hypothetical protein HY755_11790 [Nitrospirae bacterium]|nr:hypothetical protein [Nitrospirota bacterium]